MELFKISNFVFQGSPLKHDVSSGVIMSNLTLVVQHVRRAHSGKYVCHAENDEGKSKSNEIDLKIKCKSSSTMNFDFLMEENVMFKNTFFILKEF